MSVSITAYLRENANKHSNVHDLIHACMEDTGRARKNVQTAWGEICKGNSPVSLGFQPHPVVFMPSQQGKNHLSSTPPTMTGISEAQLRQKHDTKFIIQQAANSLKEGTFITETDFIKQCNVQSHQGFRQFLNDEDFNLYRGRASGTTYWSHPKSIAKMKSEGILR